MIIELDEVDEFLEHHGVKGQKWGVRNQRSTSTSSNSKSNKKRNLIIAGGIVAVGGLAAAAILKRRGAQKAVIARTANSISKMGKVSSDDIISQKGTAHLLFGNGTRQQIDLTQFRNGDFVKIIKNFSKP